MTNFTELKLLATLQPKANNGLLSLLKKKKDREVLDFIDTHQANTSVNNERHLLIQSPIINIVHFAEQEDDSDLAESPDSEAVNLVRKHLLSKCVSATLVPDNVRR